MNSLPPIEIIDSLAKTAKEYYKENSRFLKVIDSV